MIASILPCIGAGLQTPLLRYRLTERLRGRGRGGRPHSKETEEIDGGRDEGWRGGWRDRGIDKEMRDGWRDRGIDKEMEG